jgi:hypothetical protein
LDNHNVVIASGATVNRTTRSRATRRNFEQPIGVSSP